MKLAVNLNAYEGPLDLLLDLIDKNKVSIYDIPIVEITRQYMEYVDAMEKDNLDVVSEFLVMAATLLDIKSKMLLPKQEDENGEEIDPREELVARLIEYKMCKVNAKMLQERLENGGNSLYRDVPVPPEIAKYEPPVDLYDLLSNVSLLRMHIIFESIMQRQRDKIDPIRSRFGKIEKNKVRLGDKMRDVLEFARAHSKEGFSFTEFLEKGKDREDVIVSFLAVLELMHVGQISICQEEVCGDILISWNDSVTFNFDEKDMEDYE